MMRLNALLPPGQAAAIPLSPGRLSNERAGISRAKETRRSATAPDKSLPWRQHYRDALLPLVPGLGRAGAEGLWGLLKQMCFVVGIVETKKKERKICLVFKFPFEIRVQNSRYDRRDCSAPLNCKHIYASKTPSILENFNYIFKNQIIADAYC